MVDGEATAVSNGRTGGPERKSCGLALDSPLKDIMTPTYLHFKACNGIFGIRGVMVHGISKNFSRYGTHPTGRPALANANSCSPDNVSKATEKRQWNEMLECEASVRYDVKVPSD